MKKRIISLFLSLLTVLLIIQPISFPAEAADYASELRNKGFSESYIASLVALHNTYPDWSFEPIITGESWSTAVSKERTPHSNQRIEKNTLNDGKDYYCTCADCLKNGTYVVQEIPNWVSASQSAVEYYMDPRNFLTEKYIFQFEANFYNSSHTQAGVEAILSGTWMHNADITYRNEQGQTVTYYPTKKYSQAIMEAAKSSGLSAYYLASKIVQEVGGTTNSAGGASGTDANYPGIYNYYNIGAYAGEDDGLLWASSGIGYVTNINANMRSAATTSSSIVVTVPNGTMLTYNSKTGKQADGYVWYNVTAIVGGESYTGYIRSDLVDYRTTDLYNRPWTNPYLSIYNGALYIKNNFGTQYTGYLKKFNVNPDSGSNMHSHEYMTSVYAAANESVKTYNAYNSAGTLAEGKTFYIPVYTDMPGDNIPAVQNLTVSNLSTTGAKLSWNAVADASGYEIQHFLNGNWKTMCEVAGNTKTFAQLTSNKLYIMRVRAFETVNGTKIYSNNWSDPIGFSTYTTSDRMTFSNLSTSGAKATLKAVTDAGAYEIQYWLNGKWVTMCEIAGNIKTFTQLTANRLYTMRFRAFKTVDGTKVYSSNWSAPYSFTTYATVSRMSFGNINSKGATLKINSINQAGAYEIQYLLNGQWKTMCEVASNTKTFTQLTSNRKYTMRVRAFKTVNGTKSYSSNWSAPYSFITSK